MYVLKDKRYFDDRKELKNLDSSRYELLASSFLEVHDFDNNLIYYGGDQSWFDEKVANKAACGSVAAANILAYMAISESVYKALYQYDRYIDINDYMKHMNEVYTYLHPINIRLPLSSFISKSEKRISIGIPNVSRIIKGVKAFSESRNVALKAYTFSKPWTVKNAAEYIANALKDDKPIALLNGFNSNLKNIRYTYVDGRESMSSFTYHWITVTGMDVSFDTGIVDIDVSSWGIKAKLRLNDIVREDFLNAMVYFK